MKKLLIVSVKTIIFFIGWAIVASIIPVPKFTNPAIWRFFAELIPFLSVVAFTLIFTIIEKRKIPLCLINKPVQDALFGLTGGILWLGLTIGLLALLGNIHFEGINKVVFLWLWILSALINIIMQELLVRGYLYQMIKQNYNVVAATVVSTAIFTFAHGGAFEVGIIPVLNVLTMSLLMTVVLEFTGSLIAPIVMHFFWNSIGAIILGGVSLAEDYPNLINMIFSGNTLLSGGIYKIEGSVVVLVLNITFILGIILISRNRLECKS